MRILDVSAISDSKQFFPKQGTLQFLQDAYKEQLNNIAQSLIQGLGNTYSPSTIYVLWGCVNSGSGSTYNISAGAVLFNGEVFSVPAVNLTASGNVPVANISVTQYTTNADPITYSDATTANIHNIRTITIGLGASGSTISDYSAFVFLQFVTPSQVLIKGSTTAFTPSIATDPATKGYVDNSGINILAKGYTHIGDVFSGLQHYDVALGTTLPSADYKIFLTIVNNNNNDARMTWFIDATNQTATSFRVVIAEATSAIDDIYFDWFVIAR